MKFVNEVVGVLLLAVINVFVAAVVAGTTRAVACGRLGPNRFAGIRTPATLSSPAAWSAGHQAAWPIAALIAALSITATTVAVVMLIAGVGHAAIVLSYVTLGALCVGFIALVRVANRAARATPLATVHPGAE